MQIKDRPEYASKPKPLTFSATATVAEAVKAMSMKNFGSVVVVDKDNNVEGMVTERDIMKRLVNEGKSAKTTKLKDIMTSEVRVAKETDDLRDWLRVMSNERFRRLPIVDENGKLTSIMTQGDFVSYTWPELMDRIVEQTKATVSSNYQLFLLGGGVLIYSIVLIFLLRGSS